MKLLFFTSAFSPFIVLFLIRNEVYFLCKLLSYGIYTIIPFLLVLIIFGFSNKMGKEDMTIQELNPSEEKSMTVYIGTVIITLELNKGFSIENIFIILFVLVFWLILYRNNYFNPLFLIFGYRFYRVKTKDNNIFTLITKKRDLKNQSIGKKKYDNLIRINNFTFWEK